MKNIVIIVSLIFTFQFANSQGTLQFNTVINKSLFSTGANTGTNSMKEFSSFTIPDGKIWKVEFYATYATSNNIPYDEYTQGKLILKDTDGTHFIVWSRDGSGKNNLNGIFLNPGSYTAFAPYWTSTNQVGLHINGIEYNIISN